MSGFRTGTEFWNPLLLCELQAGSGDWVRIAFLVDFGAERTLLTSEVLRSLQIAVLPTPSELIGVGGTVNAVTVPTKLRLSLDSGNTIDITGPFLGLAEGPTANFPSSVATCSATSQ